MLRDAAELDSREVGTAPKGERVRVLAARDHWPGSGLSLYVDCRLLLLWKSHCRLFNGSIGHSVLWLSDLHFSQ